MKITMLVSSLLILSGCANLVKTGAVQDADKSVAKGQYARALEKTRIAESYGDITPTEHAQILYLKAQALEGLNRTEDALGYYQYVAQSLPTSPYTKRALASVARIESK